MVPKTQKTKTGPRGGVIIDPSHKTGWENAFYNRFIIQPGEHLLDIAITGSGKTNFLYWTVDGLLAARDQLPPKDWETIVWVDRGKSSEILQLVHMSPCRILVPESCSIRTEFFDPDNQYDIEIVKFSNYTDLWHMLDRDRINIISIFPFLSDPALVGPTTAKLFKVLIREAKKYNIVPKNTTPGNRSPPVALFIDEFHNIAPSRGQGLPDQEGAGAVIQLNAEQLRSRRIRLVCSTHAWRKLRPGLRGSYQWIGIQRGANFPSAEQPKLSRFNREFEKLEPGYIMLVFPNRVFTDRIKLPYYGKPDEDIGYVWYVGELKPKKRKQETQKSDISELAAILAEAIRASGQPAPSAAAPIPPNNPLANILSE